MSELEVQATRSFTCVLGNFTRGRRYRLDTGDPSVKGLVEGGFLRITRGNPVTDVRVNFDAVDTVAIDEFLGSPEESQVDDGQGETGSGEDIADSAGSGDTAGVPDGATGPKRRKSAGAKG